MPQFRLVGGSEVIVTDVMSAVTVSLSLHSSVFHRAGFWSHSGKITHIYLERKEVQALLSLYPSGEIQTTGRQTIGLEDWWKSPELFGLWNCSNKMNIKVQTGHNNSTWVHVLLSVSSSAPFSSGKTVISRNRPNTPVVSWSVFSLVCRTERRRKCGRREGQRGTESERREDR